MIYFKGQITNFFKRFSSRKEFDVEFFIGRFPLNEEVIFMMKTEDEKKIRLKMDEKEFQTMLNALGYYKKD